MELVNIHTGVITSVKPLKMLRHKEVFTNDLQQSIITYVDSSRVNTLVDENKKDRRIERIKNYAHHFAFVLREYLNDYDKCKSNVKHRKIDTWGGHKLDWFSSEVNDSEQLKWLDENGLTEVLYNKRTGCFTWSLDGYYTEMNQEEESEVATLLNYKQLPKRYILIDTQRMAEVEPDRKFTRYSPRHIAKFRQKLEEVSACTRDLQAYKEKLDEYRSKLYVVNRNSCSIRFCPCCQMFDRRKQGYVLSESLNKIHNRLIDNKDSRLLVMVTVTMPNIEIDPSGRNYKPQLIKQAKTKLSKGLTKLFRGTRDKHGGYHDPRIGFAVPDFETHFECTLSTETEWSSEKGNIARYYVHPHIHAIALFPADYSEYNPNCYVPIIKTTGDITGSLYTNVWDKNKKKKVKKDITNTAIRYHPNPSLSEIWDECIDISGSIVHIKQISYIGSYEHHLRTQLTCRELAETTDLLTRTNRNGKEYINTIWKNYYWISKKQATLSYKQKMEINYQKITEYNNSLNNLEDMITIQEGIEAQVEFACDNDEAAQWIYRDSETGAVDEIENISIMEFSERQRKLKTVSGVTEVVKYINKPDTVVARKGQKIPSRPSKTKPGVKVTATLDFDEANKRYIETKGLMPIEYYIYYFDCLASIPIETPMGMFKDFKSQVNIEKEEYKGKQNLKFTNKNTVTSSNLKKKHFTAKETLKDTLTFVETDSTYQNVLYKQKKFPVYVTPPDFQKIANDILEDKLSDI